jgi:hypothetical protein
MGKFVLEFDCDETSANLQAILNRSTTDVDGFYQGLSNYVDAVRGGARNASLLCRIGAVNASLAGTFTDAPSANDTVTVNGVTFTAKASGASTNEFNIGAGANAAAKAITNATALAAAINASVSTGVVDIVTATASGAVVTLTAANAGKVGNAIVVAESMANFTFAGAATKLSGGTHDTKVTYSHGK